MTSENFLQRKIYFIEVTHALYGFNFFELNQLKRFLCEFSAATQVLSLDNPPPTA